MTLFPSRSRFRTLPCNVPSSLAASSPLATYLLPTYTIGGRNNGLTSLKFHSKSRRDPGCPRFTTNSTYMITPSHQATSQSLCSNRYPYFQLRLSSDESKLPLLSSLQEEVLKVESYPPGFLSTNRPHHRITKIHQLMEDASSLKSIHGAEIVERLLYKVLSESLLTSHYPKGVVAQQLDEEISEQGDITRINVDPRCYDDLDKNDIHNVFDYYPIYPTMKMYTEAILAWATSVPKLSFSDKESERKRMRHHTASSPEVKHDALANSSNSSAKRAHDLLKLMITQYHRFIEDEKLGVINTPSNNQEDIRGTYNRPPRPDAVCYTAVILAYRNEGNAHVAQNILDTMISSSSNDTGVQPDAYCFRTVLQAWVEHSNPRLGLSKANQLLQKMEYLQREVKGYKDLRPDTRLYNTYLQALVNHVSPKHAWAAWNAKELLQAMVKSTDGPGADSVSFNLVIHAMAKLENWKGALQAEKVLDQMFSRYRSRPPFSLHTSKPDSTSFHTVMKAWAGCAKHLFLQEDKHNIKPNDRVEKLLKVMAQLYDEDSIEWAELKPTTITYNSALNVYKNCAGNDRTAAENANRLLERMWEMYNAGYEDVQPDKITYDTVINALINTNEYKFIDMAQGWLEHMYDYYSKSGNSRLRPEVYTIGVVLKAWSNLSPHHPDGAIRAQKLLDFIVDQYLYNRRLAVPDAMCYLSTMAAWLKSESCYPLDRVKFITDLLKNMERMHEAGISELRPTIAHYNVLLNACGLCRKSKIEEIESERVIELALHTYRRVQESALCKADESTYFWMLVIVRNLMPQEERTKHLKDIFSTCQQEGMVSKHVWGVLWGDRLKDFALSIIQNSEGTPPESYRSVPASWKRKLSKGKNTVLRK